MTDRPRRKSDAARRANQVIRGRTMLIMLLLGVASFTVLFWKLYDLQINRHDELKAEAVSQQTDSMVISASRGTIYDKNGEIIIENLRIGEYVVSEVSDGASSAYVLPADKTASVFEGAVTKVEMHNELRDTPKTGDDSNPTLWLALLGVSAAGAATLGVVGFRKRRKEDAE